MEQAPSVGVALSALPTGAGPACSCDAGRWHVMMTGSSTMQALGDAACAAYKNDTGHVMQQLSDQLPTR